MPGKSDSFIVGLSMGTTKTSMIVAKKDPEYPDGVRVLGLGNAPSLGITKGIITNPQKVQQSILRAFQDAQTITGISAEKLSNVIVAFNAMDIRSELTHGMITLGARESKAVDTEDLDRVIKRAKEDLDYELRSNMYSLHTIPTSYELDGRAIEEPLNMNGNRLDMWLHTVAVYSNYVESVRACVRSAGLKINGLILKPLASSLGAVYEEEKRAGCISICIGGGTTGIVLYKGGRAFRVISIPIGGNHITGDLTSVLRISLLQAEDLKKRIFTTNPDELRRDGFDVELATQVIIARVEELFGDYVRNALSECTPQNFPGGVILSGGVSETPEIDDMLRYILQMPVRKATRPIFSMPYFSDRPEHVGAVGILKYYADKERDPYLFMEPEQFSSGESDYSDKRERSSTRSRERERIQVYDDDEYEDDNDNNEPEYEYDDESDYYDDDNSKRETFREFVKRLAFRVKEML